MENEINVLEDYLNINEMMEELEEKWHGFALTGWDTENNIDLKTPYGHVFFNEDDLKEIRKERIKNAENGLTYALEFSNDTTIVINPASGIDIGI